MTPIKVIKRDGSRVPFDRDSLKNGLERACWKRPVSDAQINTVIAEVEQYIEMNFDTEVESRIIGEQVMEHLAKVDQVAYVRFASVYRQFQDARDFANELKPMLRHAAMMSKSGNHNASRTRTSANLGDALSSSSQDQ
jgi:transcriptional repressor NrdR